MCIVMTTYLDIHQQQVELPPGEQVQWRLAAYALVQSSSNEVLLVTQQHDKIRKMLPGGEVELTESIEDGLRRECYEETGYKIQIDSQVPIFVGESHFYFNGFFHCINMVFQSSLKSNDQNTAMINSIEPNEIESVDWIPLADISEQNCHHIIYPAIQSLQ